MKYESFEEKRIQVRSLHTLVSQEDHHVPWCIESPPESWPELRQEAWLLINGYHWSELESWLRDALQDEPVLRIARALTYTDVSELALRAPPHAKRTLAVLLLLTAGAQEKTNETETDPLDQVKRAALEPLLAMRAWSCSRQCSAWLGAVLMQCLAEQRTNIHETWRKEAPDIFLCMRELVADYVFPLGNKGSEFLAKTYLLYPRPRSGTSYMTYAAYILGKMPPKRAAHMFDDLENPEEKTQLANAVCEAAAHANDPKIFLIARKCKKFADRKMFQYLRAAQTELEYGLCRDIFIQMSEGSFNILLFLKEQGIFWTRFRRLWYTEHNKQQRAQLLLQQPSALSLVLCDDIGSWELEGDLFLLHWRSCLALFAALPVQSLDPEVPLGSTTLSLLTDPEIPQSQRTCLWHSLQHGFGVSALRSSLTTLLLQSNEKCTQQQAALALATLAPHMAENED
ncbi:MAG: hypothetical protein N3A02_00150 [Rectinema sp.]|nr:hypothetical protein [Rectinema sp.]